MVRVGILSMQRIFNYGSFLQAYGLKSILEELGCDVQFVDYHPGKCLISSRESTGYKRKIKKVMDTFKYKAPLIEKIRFINYKRNYAVKYYPFLGITDKMNFDTELDVLVIGSDEVFNCVQDNTNVGYTPELFGVGSNAKKTISYAASFGNTTLNKLKKYDVDKEIGNWLKTIDALSVRDENSKRIVYELTGVMPQLNLDPVLMYDFLKQCKNIPNHVQESKYMILYGYSGRFTIEECTEIRKYANKKGLKIFCIGGVQNCCDKFIDCNPFEVITYFQKAECVITDTFHGTILSVITHKQFVVVIRSSGYGNSEKITDLCCRLMLNNRILLDIQNLNNLLDKPALYDITDTIIQKERNHTRSYLKEQIFD